VTDTPRDTHERSPFVLDQRQFDAFADLRQEASRVSSGSVRPAPGIGGPSTRRAAASRSSLTVP
jgi:hypothetical protein